MKIKRAKLYKVEIPMITDYTSGVWSISRNPVVIVRIETECGRTTYGESPCRLQAAHPIDDNRCITALQEALPSLLARDFSSPADCMQAIEKHVAFRLARTGLETACWAAFCAIRGISLAQLLGGERERIAVGESVNIKHSLEEVCAEVEMRLRQNFRRIKLKIKPGWDLDVVKAVRETFPSISLMVDGNALYTLDDLQLFQEMDRFHLLMIENPFEGIEAHAVLQQQIQTPICLDECIHSVHDVRNAIAHHACHIINIKPGKVGGLLESKKIHDLCFQHEIGVWCGGMLETSIGRAFNIALSSLPNFVYPADMSPPHFYYSDDLVKERFVVDSQGYVSVPSQAGPGFYVDEDKLDQYTTSAVAFY